MWVNRIQPKRYIKENKWKKERKNESKQIHDKKKENGVQSTRLLTDLDLIPFICVSPTL